MTSKKEPDFGACYDLANEILITSTVIEAFPFSIKKVIKRYADVNCIKENNVQTLCDQFGLPDPEYFNIESLGSKDASLFEYGGRNIIIYRDDGTITPKRIKWSLAHELGHFLRQHDTNDKLNYDTYEIEANFFAAQLLMPVQIINEFRRRKQTIDRRHLMKWFGISGKAADKRIETLRKIDGRNLSEEEKMIDGLIIQKYSVFINETVPLPSRTTDFFDEDEEMERERDSWRSSRRY